MNQATMRERYRAEIREIYGDVDGHDDEPMPAALARRMNASPPATGAETRLRPHSTPDANNQLTALAESGSNAEAADLATAGQA